ncbi:hypothetical protein LC608_22450 [Nostoc sp. XA010]|uniref:hypothetical protein n=1 Tax=Nostoc sp. XA010 TaxID=2780407 RepID=UPI001E612CA9|nr:hypothetical protein [Nostoc sp. XA010]MCC5659681.1 hypothetical protein [Nostoc sp. XA010]
MGKSLRERIKEQPIENQIKIESRAQELISQELTRQKLRLDKRKRFKKREVVIFGKKLMIEH